MWEGIREGLESRAAAEQVGARAALRDCQVILEALPAKIVEDDGAAADT